jgi:glycogen debranching enzyme
LTRRYHGLLIAALEPPVKRTVLLSKLDETVVLGEKNGTDPRRFELGTNQYPGAVYPTGFQYLKRFERDLFPVFHYAAGGVLLKKTCVAIHGENTTVVLYEVEAAPRAFQFELLPLASARDHHGIGKDNPAIGRQYLFDDGIFRTVNYPGGAELFISVPGSVFTESQAWYYHFEYLREMERGLEFREDLYTHGRFELSLNQGDRLGVILSTEDPTGRDAFVLFDTERKRRLALQEMFQEAPTTRPATHASAKVQMVVRDAAKKPKITPAKSPQGWSRLTLAADQFIVRRGEGHTVIAGYPWFSDWGRDTMISLPGLCLSTGRVDIARQILRQYAHFVSEGMLPNRFPDHGELPEYNTFDATLWFFHAIYQYYLTSNDLELVREISPVLSDIVAWHTRGTRYGIVVDPSDHLLRGGVPGVQLTWMDAKVGDWVVTPRIGKPVEINALWYNALRVMETFHLAMQNETEARKFADSARTVRDSFQIHFWNPRYSCLYDYLDESPHAEVRPNQLYAVSLPFPLLTEERAQAVLDKVRETLVTPLGLRSLAPGTPGYQGMCVGGPLQRDAAYHQGTVWSYWVGAYIDALFAVEGEAARDEASKLVQSCIVQLDQACVGSISEIFDGDWPHAPRGCIAQAWSVAELLRVRMKYAL